MTNGSNGGDRLDLLTDQIGRLTEQIAQSNLAIANGFAETRANIEKLGEKIDSGFSELKAISQAQHEEINRLVEVTDRQAKTVDKLTDTVARQAETTAQQAKMLEQLLSSRIQNN